ncbi:hypothetical protein MPSEU_001029400 [Mayamaea pseudoterrestris]|nr:hypothetical protein MPSEU_001029400 [Mayamaea pseudoterrestris]
MSQQWSPFECLSVASQTSAGLLQKEASEVEIIQRSNVELRSAMEDPMVPITSEGLSDSVSGKKWVGRCTNLTLEVTTHRIVLWKVEQRDRQARFLHLSHLMQASPETSFLKSPKILLNTYSGDLLLVFSNASVRDDVLQHITKALKRQVWQVEEQLEQSKKRSSNLTAHKVGVDAIMAKSKLKHQQAAKVTDQAFAGDAETLFKEAQELVAIIHKYVATLDKQNETSKDENAQLVGLLQDMGMTSALPKSDFAGRMDTYYETLARQLADFILPKLKATGGVMTLTDSYCLFNRSRASNLISPEDLVKAVDCLERLGIELSKRVFASGLVVLQNDSVNDLEIAKKLQEISKNGLHEMDAARLLRTSALLAHEQLLVAEQMGFLARDESLESIRYYPNRFDEWAAIYATTNH